MTKGNLIPKQIVNSAGVSTTVYVRPDQAENINGDKLRGMGAPASVANTSATLNVPQEAVSFTLGERAGAKMEIILPEGDGDPYSDTEYPVIGQVTLSDGAKIRGYYYLGAGWPAKDTFRDGVRMTQELGQSFPMYSPSNWEEPDDAQRAAFDRLSSKEYLALDQAMEAAVEFNRDELGDSEGLRGYEVDEMTREELVDLMKQRYDENHHIREAGRAKIADLLDRRPGAIE